MVGVNWDADGLLWRHYNDPVRKGEEIQLVYMLILSRRLPAENSYLLYYKGQMVSPNDAIQHQVEYMF